MRIAMVGARFSGLDGVSLESAKVAEALERSRHSVGWFAGEIGPGFEPRVEMREASFGTVTNRALQDLAFRGGDAGIAQRMISGTSAAIRDALLEFLRDFQADVMLVENAWAIPMQLPLAVAAAEAASQTGIPTIGHHHDFAWERPRFATCTVPEVVDQYFPPDAPNIQHVVINSIAQEDLNLRRGLRSTVLPNVMDFELGEDRIADCDSFRETAMLDAEDVVLLQPTRIITRKGIELTIELAARMDCEPKVIVSHPDDRDDAYWGRLEGLARSRGVDLRLVDAGRSRHALESAYAAADLVCLPSFYEGYGNALVEAVFYERPVFVNRYSVYEADIAPLGFDFIEVDGSVTDEAVDAANRIVRDPSMAQQIGSSNFEIGRENLSYARVTEVMETAYQSMI